MSHLLDWDTWQQSSSTTSSLPPQKPGTPASPPGAAIIGPQPVGKADGRASVKVIEVDREGSEDVDNDEDLALFQVI